MNKLNPLDIALSHARGCYQVAIVYGDARWSGADLRGKAKRYGAHYHASRYNLLRRLQSDPRLAVRVVAGAHGRLVLDIGGAS